MITAYLWNFSSQIIAFTEDKGSCDESLQQIHEDRDKLKMDAYQDFTPEKGEIVFDNLSFAYNAETPLFKGFQLHIKAGERVGIVGRSGSGKSTLVKLLLRFYDVDNEEIHIDRQNITNVGYASLRQNIAVIPQDASLFNRSVLENIRYGRLDATDEDVMDAAKKAQAHKFISDLPNGYNTTLGDRGTKLSGGQRQRVAIARAILKDAQILVLDEATSALDSESEMLVQKALDIVMEGRTVVAIAHRLSTLSNMDRIIVLEEGDLVEDGSHEELLAKKGRYYDLWNMQSGNFVDTSDEQ
jgi:ATP-binding cassette subfamily B protein